MIKNYLSYAVAAAFFAASGTSFAVDEEQQDQLNKPFSKPQGLVIDESRKVEVKGRIGSSEFGDPVPDTDFYAFHGKAGDLVKLDIDGGIKAAGTGRSLNSLIAIFNPDGTVLAQKMTWVCSRSTRDRSLDLIRGSRTSACPPTAYIPSG